MHGAPRPSVVPMERRRRRRAGTVLGALLAVAALAAGATAGWLAWRSDEPALMSVLPVGALPASTELALDANPVELGLRFSAEVEGTVAGLRIYRGPGQVAVHPARLWASDGTVLGQLTFAAPTGPGWQSVLFNSPVPIDGGSFYTASYHADGGYLADAGYFDAGSVDDGSIDDGSVDDGATSRSAALLHPDPAGAGVFAYGSTPTQPTQTIAGTNYWIDVLFLASDPIQPAEVRPTPEAVAQQFSVPQRGEVGFTGDRSALAVIDSPASAPAGTTWSDGTLRVDAANVTLSRVWVKGGVDYYGEGTLAIRNSIVEANGSSWAVVWGRSAAGTLDISDSTVVWPADVPAPGPTWGTGAINGDSRMILVRNDISGTVDGVQQSTGNSLFQQNYIHDLRLLGTYPDNSHNDGLQLYGGPNVEVLYNHIELNGYDGEHQNAAVFLSDDGPGFQAPQIVGNYLSGGGFTLRLEQGITDAVVTDNTFGPVAGGFGYVALQPGSTLAQWSGNTAVNGNLVPEPRAG